MRMVESLVAKFVYRFFRALDVDHRALLARPRKKPCRERCDLSGSLPERAARPEEQINFARRHCVMKNRYFALRSKKSCNFAVAANCSQPPVAQRLISTPLPEFPSLDFGVWRLTRA